MNRPDREPDGTTPIMDALEPPPATTARKKKAGLPPPARNPNVLTIGQLARILGVCTRTAVKLVDRGDISGWRIGNDRRTTRQAISHYVASKPGLLAAMRAGEIIAPGIDPSLFAAIAADAWVIAGGGKLTVHAEEPKPWDTSGAIGLGVGPIESHIDRRS